LPLGTEIVTEPLEPEAIVTLVPATKYGDPSASRVREPEMPFVIDRDPVISKKSPENPGTVRIPLAGSKVKDELPERDPLRLNWTFVLDPPGEDIPPPPVEDMVIWPLEEVVSVTLFPATR
jgi:hypothetical protein